MKQCIFRFCHVAGIQPVLMKFYLPYQKACTNYYGCTAFLSKDLRFLYQMTAFLYPETLVLTVVIHWNHLGSFSLRYYLNIRLLIIDESNTKLRLINRGQKDCNRGCPVYHLICCYFFFVLTLCIQRVMEFSFTCRVITSTKAPTQFLSRQRLLGNTIGSVFVEGPQEICPTSYIGSMSW